MPAMSLNDYTILTRDLEATKDFYTDIVGLSVGDRPPLNFPGYWLYCGDVPTVHLIGHRPEDLRERIAEKVHSPLGRVARRLRDDA